MGHRHVLIDANPSDNPGPVPGLFLNAVTPAPTLDIARYGQVFTPAGIVERMLALSRNIGRNIQAFVGAQNLFDTVYFVQTNPSTIGTPRLVNGGVRVRWSAK